MRQQNDDTIPFSKNHKIDSHVPNEDNIRPKVEVREERDGNGIGGENSSTEKGKGKEKEIEAMEAKPKLEDDGTTFVSYLDESGRESEVREMKNSP